MKWTKVVLLFQAAVTLIIGMVFFYQVIELDKDKISEFNVEISNTDIFDSNPQNVIIDIKKRYTGAAYILGFVSILEMILIGRAVSG